MNVSDLSGDLLNYWVAKAEGLDPVIHEHRGVLVSQFPGGQEFSYWPAENWEQAGPIIEREKIMICFEGSSGWGASPPDGCWNPGECSANELDDYRYGVGPTPLVAAMRAFVASKFGEEVPT
jgi:hypothetical protein